MRFGIRELIFFVVLIGLCAWSYVFVVKKTNEKKDAKEASIRQKEKALADVNAATAGIDDLGRKIDDLQKAIDFFESKLPQAKEVDKILKEIWQMAEANDLQAKTVKTLKSERNANYSEQPIQMTVIGNADGYYQFLQQLEKLPRLTRVTQMNLQKSPDRDGDVTAQMTLVIFFEPEGFAAAG